MIQDFVRQVGSYAVNGIDSDSLGCCILSLDDLLKEKRQKLVIISCELVLHMEHQRNYALEQLLMGLKDLRLKHYHNSVSKIIKPFKEYLIWTIDEDLC